MEESRSPLDVRKRMGVIVVTFLDRKILDELNIARIEEQLFSLVDGAPEVRLVLDFVNVEHLSSRALGTLISLMKRVRGRQGRMALANIADRIFEVFTITRLDQSFDVYDDCEQAVAAVGTERGPGNG